MLVIAALCSMLGSFALCLHVLEARRIAARRRRMSWLHRELSMPEKRRPSSSFLGRFAKRHPADVSKHVPQLFDAVALGMKAGLSFDAAFALYCSRFDDELARRCADARRAWETGISTRNEALAAMASRLEDPALERFATSVERSIRFGSPMGRMLGALSREASGAYRSKIEERVAKAPVKMLVPTATLILPAMLIVVLGPVLLDLA